MVLPELCFSPSRWDHESARPNFFLNSRNLVPHPFLAVRPAHRRTLTQTPRLRSQAPRRPAPRQTLPPRQRSPEKPTKWTFPRRRCGSIRRSTCSQARRFSSRPPARRRIPRPIRRGSRKCNPSAPKASPADGATSSTNIPSPIPAMARSSRALARAMAPSPSPSTRARRRPFPSPAGFFSASIRACAKPPPRRVRSTSRSR